MIRKISKISMNDSVDLMNYHKEHSKSKEKA